MASVNSKVVGIKAEVLNDLASRFLINLSSEEKDPLKLCTYIELAHWYYLDLMRPEDPSLPACNLKEFMRALFQHCPWLLRDTKQQDLDKLITDWKNHKFSKPVRGAIILDRDMTKCLLVQGYTAGTSWGFPKGKLEEGEADIDAAVREVYEETGFDIRALVSEKLYLEANIRDTNVRMYLIVGVAESTVFEPKTRNEIKNIQWFNIKDLPSYKKDVESLQALGKSSNNFFMIIPFIGQLRRWIKSRRSKRKGISANLSSPEQALSSSQLKKEPVSPQPKRAQSLPQPKPAQSQSQSHPQFQTSALWSRSGPHQGTVGSVATTPLLATPSSHTTNPSYNPLRPVPILPHTPLLATTSRPVPILPRPLVTPVAMYPSHLSYRHDARQNVSPQNISPSRQWIHNNPSRSAVNPQGASTGQLAALMHINPALQQQMSPRALLQTGAWQQTSPRVLLPSSTRQHMQQMSPRVLLSIQQHRTLLPSPKTGYRLPPPRAVLPLGYPAGGHQQGAAYSTTTQAAGAQTHRAIQPYGTAAAYQLQQAQQHRPAVRPVTPQRGNVLPTLRPRMFVDSNSVPSTEAQHRITPPPPDGRNMPLLSVNMNMAQPTPPVAVGVAQSTPPVAVGVAQSTPPVIDDIQPTPPMATPTTTAPIFYAKSFQNFHFDKEAIMNSYCGIEVRQ